MKIRINIRLFCYYILVILLSLYSCSDETMIDDVFTEEENKRDEGVPMVLNLNFEDEKGKTRASDYQWKDGATLLLYPIDSYDLKGNDGTYIYAVYHESTGWIAYNLSGKETSGNRIEVIFSESWTYDSIKSDEYSSSSSGGSYRNNWYDYDDLEWYYTPTSYSYEDGIFYLSTRLKPIYGRVRFVSELPMVVEYNHALNNCKNYPDADNGKDAAAISTLEFHQETDGKYYSNYIYANAIPELKIGDYVYKYRGNTILQEGVSGCITLPVTSETTNTWICEKYFEINYDSQTIECNGDEFSYYQLYAKEFSERCGDTDPNGNIGNGPNLIHSLIGLNVELDFTVNSSLTDNFHIGMYIKSKMDGYLGEYYSGEAYFPLRSPNVGLRRLIRIHNCYTELDNWFCPYLYIGNSIIESACVANVTLHKIKFSNF